MSPRRLVFLLVLLLWATNGALLAWVKVAGPSTGADKVLVVVHSDNQAAAKKMQKALEAAGLPVEYKSNQSWKREVVDGYKVYLTQANPDLRKALSSAMTMKGLPVKSGDGELQLGGTYRTKADANKARANAQTKGFSFQVKENRVQRSIKASQLIVGPVDEEGRATADQTLAKFKLKPDQVTTEDVGAEAESKPAK
jgi:hypothetical protein